MAIGTALLFNIKLPANFNSPYKARSIQDFWHRWHMTLSRFLRDYIYIPLGGNRRGNGHTYLNLFITFLIGGIWHGAGWTFVFWGALHGIGIIVHRIWKQLGYAMPALLGWFITFNFINITWVFFRAKEWDDALKVLKGMFAGPVVLNHAWQVPLAWTGLPFGAWLQHIYADEQIFAWLLFAMLTAFLLPNSHYWRQTFRPNALFLGWGILMATYALLDLNKVSEFLYFNF